jgi:hypothetical protein
MLLKSSGGGGQRKDFEDGTWRAKVDTTRIYKKDDGSESLVVVWVGAADNCQDCEFADFVKLVPQCEWRIAQVWEAVGLGQFPGEGETYDSDMLVGREAMIELTTESYLGKARKRLERVRSV